MSTNEDKLDSGKQICEKCFKEKKCNKFSFGLICSSCYQKFYAPREVCSNCGTEGLVYKRLESRPICKSCYNKYYLPKKICSVCNKEGIINKRIDDKNICKVCYDKYYRPTDICSRCSQVGVVFKRDEDGCICQSCYNRYYKPKHKCSLCNHNIAIKKINDSEFICQSCYRENYSISDICSVCNNLKTTFTKVNGKLVCSSCYNKLYRPKQLCHICNTENIISLIKNGYNICRNCYDKYYRPIRTCSICGITGKIILSKSCIDICRSCYKKYYQPQGVCSECKKEKSVHLNYDGKAICKSCYDKLYRPKRICSICGKKNIIKKVIDKNDICVYCYNKYYLPKSVCFLCNKVSRTYKKIKDNNVCQLCYIKHYIPRHQCSCCGKISSIAKKISERNVCAKCYEKLYETCSLCGTQTRYFNYTSNLCENCYYSFKIREFVESVKHSFNHEKIFLLFVKYIHFLMQSRQSKTAFNTVKLCLDIFRTLDSIYADKKISYEYLYQLYNDIDIRGKVSLNYFLLKEGLLQEIDSYESFGKQCAFYAEKLDKKFRYIYLSYSKHLELRRKSFEEKGWHDRFTLKTCNTYAHDAFIFFKFASSKVNSIYELSDEIVDEFLVGSKSISRFVRHLVKWLNQNIRFFRKLSIPKYDKIYINLDPYSEKELSQIFKALLKDHVRLKDKVICCLVLIYALRSYELINLKLSHYKKENGDTFLFFRNTWVKLNQFISELLEQHLASRYFSNNSFSNDDDWIFPGSIYNTPISRGHVLSILRKYNINVQRAFRSVIINALITNDVLPGSLIRGLGLNKGTIFEYYYALNIVGTYETKEKNTTHLNLLGSADSHYVYIVKCSDGSYYSGYTSNIEARIKQHNDGFGSKYTKSRKPVELVYQESFPDKKSALKREKQIKKLDTYKKEHLISKRRTE